MSSSADKLAGAPSSCGGCEAPGRGYRRACRQGRPGRHPYPKLVIGRSTSAPHHDDRIIVTTAAGTRTEELGRRSSYTYQLEAFAAHLRDRAPLPTDADDAVANMQLIDDCYRAAGLTPRPAGQPLINEAAH